MRFGLYTMVALFLFASTAVATVEQTAKKQIGILVFDGVLTSDVTAPAEVFGAAAKDKSFAEYEVILVSTTPEKEIVTDEGLKLVADASIMDELSLEVLVVPSAWVMEPFVENKNLINFVQEQSRTAKWLASNCAGAFVLGASGVLDGYEATTYSGGHDALQKAYPKIKARPDQVVMDGRNVTSDGGLVSYASALLLLEKMSSKELADKVADILQLERMLSYYQR